MTESKKFPIPSSEQEDIEESLGMIWDRSEKGIFGKGSIKEDMDKAVSPKAYGVLLKRKFLFEKGEKVELTESGKKLAKDITRRHRLAERLLSDVLSLDKGDIDPNACQLEHIISPEVTESICTLLGHPIECPHGSAIPSGACCRRSDQELHPIVTPLSKMSPGEEGKISYLRLQNHPELHKLLSLGVVPGTMVRLHQTFPTYVLEIGESQLALEEEVAKNIYVRNI